MCHHYMLKKLNEMNEMNAHIYNKNFCSMTGGSADSADSVGALLSIAVFNRG